MQLVVHQAAVVVGADLRGRHAIRPRVEHIAQELDGGIGALRQLHGFEAQPIQLFGGASQFPAGENSTLALQRDASIRQ